VLTHHWPGVPIYDDVRGVTQPPKVEVLCGGFPCQDLSVAGNRAGLAGSRSGLFFEFARIIDAIRPRWVLVENVPGLLSSNSGRDFGIVLGTLADLGYGVAWRVLDSRYFGVPQRRRRVYILATLADGDPRGAAERAGQVLAVGTRCPGHPATSREARPDVAGTLGGGAGERGWAQDTERMTFLPTDGVSYSLTQGGRLDPEFETFVTHTLTSEGADASEDGTGRGTPLAVTGFHMTQDPISTAELVPAIGSKSGGQGVGVGVRRLTPTECERLQALPDGWTNHGPDSRRYSALGDAVTCSVARWIGQRLKDAT
jgi:DNA (cytosine-5)-methyltransferase 1